MHEVLCCVECYKCINGTFFVHHHANLYRESWKDTMGRRIEAHGGGMLQANGTYYW